MQSPTIEVMVTVTETPDGTNPDSPLQETVSPPGCAEHPFAPKLGSKPVTCIPYPGTENWREKVKGVCTPGSTEEGLTPHETT